MYELVVSNKNKKLIFDKGMSSCRRSCSHTVVKGFPIIIEYRELETDIVS